MSCSGYVDDLAGASFAGLAWTAGKVLTAMSLLLGVVCDQMKAADDAMQMTILGVQVRIIMGNVKITVQLDDQSQGMGDRHARSVDDGQMPVGIG